MHGKHSMISQNLYPVARQRLANWPRIHQLPLVQGSKFRATGPLVNLRCNYSVAFAPLCFKTNPRSNLINNSKCQLVRSVTTNKSKPSICSDEVTTRDQQIQRALSVENQTLQDFIMEYRKLTWYFLPPDNYGLLDSTYIEKIEEGSLQKEPFTFNVIAKDGELECAINLVQCLVESPFHQDLEPQFSKLRALTEKFNKEDHLEISFENCEVPLLNCFEEPPLLRYSTIAQPTKHRVACNIPLSKHFSKNSVNLLATKGYDTLGHLDLPGDHLFVIIKDFNSAFDLVNILNKHLFASTFSNRLHVIVDNEDSTLTSAIRHLCNRVSIEIPIYAVRISQGLEALKLLKKSSSNATIYQYGWTHSGMLGLHNNIKNKLNLNELEATKDQRNASVQQHFIRLAKQNLMTRLKHSDLLLKASKDTLEALAFLESELTQGFEATLATLKLETNSIIAKLSPRKLAFIRIPKYIHEIHLLLPEVPFYETEVILAEYQGFSRAQLKKFWDSNSAALVNLASDRPNIVLPKVDLDLPILHQEVRLMRGTLDLNSIVEALSEYQEQLYLRVSAAIGGGCLAGYTLFSTVPDPYFAYTIAALAYATLHGTFKSYGIWSSHMNELESRIKNLDQDFASKTTLVFQSQLEAARSPLTTLINGNIKPFHEQLSARIKTQLRVADSLECQKHSK